MKELYLKQVLTGSLSSINLTQEQGVAGMEAI